MEQEQKLKEQHGAETPGGQKVGVQNALVKKHSE